MKLAELALRDEIYLDTPERLQKILDMFEAVFPVTFGRVKNEIQFKLDAVPYYGYSCLIVPRELREKLKDVDNEWTCVEVDFWKEHKPDRPKTTVEANMWLRDKYEELRLKKEEFYKEPREKVDA